MRKILCLAGFIFVITLIAGCYIPEQFDANVVFKKDGSYIFSYNGTLANILFLTPLKNGAKMLTEEDVKKDAAELSKIAGFKKVNYQGNGRYKVSFEKSGTKNEPMHFVSSDLNLMSIVPQKDGTIVVRSFQPTAKDLASFKTIGLKIDGKLKVKLPSGMQVIKTNSQGKPKFFGLLGGYTWQIKSAEESPVLILKP